MVASTLYEEIVQLQVCLNGHILRQHSNTATRREFKQYRDQNIQHGNREKTQAMTNVKSRGMLQLPRPYPTLDRHLHHQSRPTELTVVRLVDPWRKCRNASHPHRGLARPFLSKMQRPTQAMQRVADSDKTKTQ
jgi:hypothetical protein